MATAREFVDQVTGVRYYALANFENTTEWTIVGWDPDVDGFFWGALREGEVFDRMVPHDVGPQLLDLIAATAGRVDWRAHLDIARQLNERSPVSRVVAEVASALRSA